MVLKASSIRFDKLLVLFASEESDDDREGFLVQMILVLQPSSYDNVMHTVILGTCNSV